MAWPGHGRAGSGAAARPAARLNATHGCPGAGGRSAHRRAADGTHPSREAPRLFEVDAPGLKRDDIEVETTGGELRISGEYRERQRTGWLRTRTRRLGRFEYRATLPAGVDADKVTAKLADGVLTLRVPKSEVATPRRIEITAG